MENKIQLYKRASIISANNGLAVAEILTKKAQEYNFSEARILDYIGKSLNDIQDTINDLQYEKTISDLKLKQAKKQKEEIEIFIANGLEILGLTDLKDKSASILSSLTINEAVEEKEELKQRKMTQSEMEEKLKGYGESLYITEAVKVEAKPKTIKANFKRGAKVAELKPKDAIELFSKNILNEDYLIDENLK